VLTKMDPRLIQDGRARFQRLKLRYDKPLSSFAVSYNLRRYDMGSGDVEMGECSVWRCKFRV